MILTFGVLCSIFTLMSVFGYPGLVLVTVHFLPCTKPFLSSIQCHIPFGFTRLSLLCADYIITLQMAVNQCQQTVFGLAFSVFHLWLQLRRVNNSIPTPEQYRELQVLELLTNTCYSGSILPMVLFLVPLTQVLFNCVVFLAYRKDQLLISGSAFVLSILATWFSVTVHTMAGYVYKKSRGHLLQLTRTQLQTKYQKRLLKSLYPLRLKAFSNFVDNLTPLRIQHFCAIQSAKMILMQKLQL